MSQKEARAELSERERFFRSSHGIKGFEKAFSTIQKRFFGGSNQD